MAYESIFLLETSPKWRRHRIASELFSKTLETLCQLRHRGNGLENDDKCFEKKSYIMPKKKSLNDQNKGLIF